MAKLTKLLLNHCLIVLTMVCIAGTAWGSRPTSAEDCENRGTAFEVGQCWSKLCGDWQDYRASQGTGRRADHTTCYECCSKQLPWNHKDCVNYVWCNGTDFWGTAGMAACKTHE